MNDASTIRANLGRVIDDLAAHPELFSKNPEINFTRNRKIPPGHVLRFLILMERDSVDMELLKYFEYDPDATPTQSAYIRQRSKPVPGTFRMFLDRFNSTLPPTLYLNKYVLYGIDGSGFNIATPMTRTLSTLPAAGRNSGTTKYMSLHPAALRTIFLRMPSSSREKRKMNIRPSAISSTILLLTGVSPSFPRTACMKTSSRISRQMNLT